MNEKARSLASFCVAAAASSVLLGFAMAGDAGAQAPVLEPRKVLLESLELKVPKDFVKMPPETVKKTYTPASTPNVILMSPDASVTIGISHTLSRVAPNQMARERSNAAIQMKTAYPNAEWLRNEPNPIGNAGGYLLDLKINTGTSTAKRMMIVGTSLSGRLLNIVLIAPVKDEAAWAPTFDQIIDSIKIL